MDSQNILFLGVGVLIALGFVTVMLLIQRQPQTYTTSPTNYVAVPQGLRQ